MENNNGKEHRDPTSNCRSRMGNFWRKKLDSRKDYTLTDKLEPDYGIGERHLIYDEYQRAVELKTKLLKEYQGQNIEEVLQGKELKTTYGSCFSIHHRIPYPFELPPRELSRDRLLSSLRLLYGIGERTEQHLKLRDYDKIDKLIDHTHFGEQAKNFLRLLEHEGKFELIGWVRRWVTGSHPALLAISALHDKEDFLFCDIESLGLFSRPIILLGIAYFDGDYLESDQYLLRDYDEEAGIIEQFLQQTNSRKALVTFNGARFDIPYIMDRAGYYGLHYAQVPPNFDLLYFCRKTWGNFLPNCRLKTIEKEILQIDRENDVPSAMVPEFYQTYWETGNPGPLIPIIEHNRQDMVSMVKILTSLWNEWIN